MKKKPQKKYVSHDEYTLAQILKIIVKAISFLGTFVSILLFFIFTCAGTNTQSLVCGIITIVSFVTYNLFPIENY